MQNFSSDAHQFKRSQTDTRQLDTRRLDTRQSGLWATIIAIVFVAGPATYPGYWQSAEGFVPIFNAAQSRPIADIATLPDFWRGMGSATFLLTQPLLSLADLVSLDLQKTTAVRVTFILALLMGGLGIYAWLLPKLGDRSAGLAAALYALFPPFLTTIYARGSLSDALIMGLFPIALMGASSYKRTRAISGLGALLVSILWMWRVQAGMALFATILLLLYIGIVEQDWRGILGAIVGGALGLATWFLFGNITAPSAVSFTDNFVPFYQLLLNRLLPTNSEMMEQAIFQPTALHLGFALLGLVILTLWYWRFGYTIRRDEEATQDHLDDMPSLSSSLTRLLWFSLIGCVLLVSCSLAFSNPLWQATGANRLLTYPFQTVLLSAPFWAMFAGSLLVVNRSFMHTPYWLVLILLTLLNGAPYLLPNYTQFVPADQPFAMVGDGYDTIVLNATLTEDFTQPSEEQSNSATTLLPTTKISNPPEAILEVTWQTLHTPEFDYNVFFQALIVDGEELTVLTQIDGQPLEGKRPATTWLPGEILTDRYRLDLSDLPQRADGEPIALRYYFGYYDWREGGARQPILLADSKNVDDKLTFYGQ